jgi:hypothetical protein
MYNDGCQGMFSKQRSMKWGRCSVFAAKIQVD